MEISSRQIVALGAPLIVTYLTWSAVSGEVAPAPAPKGTVISTASASKRPQIGALARNPFAPASQSSDGDSLAALDGEASDTEQANAPLKLDGTVVTGRWRMAIINGERVFEGQSFRGRLRLEKVTTNSVTLVSAIGEPIQLYLDIARPVAPANAKKTGAKVTGTEASTGASVQTGKDDDGRDAGRASTAKKPGDD
jgi:hypothetical protein